MKSIMNSKLNVEVKMHKKKSAKECGEIYEHDMIHKRFCQPLAYKFKMYNFSKSYQQRVLTFMREIM
jgi:hypothetical protein